MGKTQNTLSEIHVESEPCTGTSCHIVSVNMRTPFWILSANTQNTAFYYVMLVIKLYSTTRPGEKHRINIPILIEAFLNFTSKGSFGPSYNQSQKKRTMNQMAEPFEVLQRKRIRNMYKLKDPFREGPNECSRSESQGHYSKSGYIKVFSFEEESTVVLTLRGVNSLM